MSFRYGWTVDDGPLCTTTTLTPPASTRVLASPELPVVSEAPTLRPPIARKSDTDLEVSPEYDFRDWVPTPTHPKDPIFSIWSRDYVNRYRLGFDSCGKYNS